MDVLLLNIKLYKINIAILNRKTQEFLTSNYQHYEQILLKTNMSK